MDGYTDLPLRQMLVKYGSPDVFFTEFVSADGLSSKKGRKNLTRILEYKENERPIVAQLFGSNPDTYTTASEFIIELGFDGIDINMGCPDRKVFSNGAGSALVENIPLAKQIIQKTKKAAGNIPVSIKTRIGISDNSIKTWIPALLEEEPEVITIHGRTKTQMYKGKADWESIKEAVEIRDRLGSKTLIIGNGDVSTYQDGIEKCLKYGTDGFMIARAMIGNPWIFNKNINKTDVDLKEIFKAMIVHSKLYEENMPQGNKFYPMRKHLQEYLSGFRYSKQFRLRLVTVNNSKEVEELIEEYKAESHKP